MESAGEEDSSLSLLRVPDHGETAGEDHATTPPSAPAQAASAVSKGKSKQRQKRGRPPKKDKTEPFKWTEAQASVLLKMRYIEMPDRFDGVRSNQDIRESWEMLAAGVEREILAEVGAEQCKNKLKHLLRLWTAYNSDLAKTGNSSAPIEPPCLELMRDLWGQKDGLQASPFISSTTQNPPVHAATAVSVSTVTSRTEERAGIRTSPISSSSSTSTTTSSKAASRQTKKAKTQGEHVAEGMHSLSKSISKVASAIIRSSHVPSGGGEGEETPPVTQPVLQAVMLQQQHQAEISEQLLQQQQLQAQVMQQMLAQLTQIGDKLSRHD